MPPATRISGVPHRLFNCGLTHRGRGSGGQIRGGTARVAQSTPREGFRTEPQAGRAAVGRTVGGVRVSRRVGRRRERTAAATAAVQSPSVPHAPVPHTVPHTPVPHTPVATVAGAGRCSGRHASTSRLRSLPDLHPVCGVEPRAVYGRGRRAPDPPWGWATTAVEACCGGSLGSASRSSARRRRSARSDRVAVPTGSRRVPPWRSRGCGNGPGPNSGCVVVERRPGGGGVRFGGLV